MKKPTKAQLELVVARLDLEGQKHARQEHRAMTSIGRDTYREYRDAYETVAAMLREMAEEQ